jgi:hypothetical protein
VAQPLQPQHHGVATPWPTDAVELAVYNLLGQKVRTLAFGLQDAGEHSVPFTAGELASGVYVVELKAGGHSQTQKVLLLK